MGESLRENRWFGLARFAWIVVAVSAIGMFVAGIPFALAAYSKIGALVPPELMASLQAQDVVPERFAMLMVASITFSGFVWVAVGLLIFLRKRDDWFALVVSLALVTWGTQTSLRGALAQAVPEVFPLFYGLSIISWVLLALFFALFPNGRFVPRWIRWLVLIWAILIGLPQQVTELVPDVIVGITFLAFWALSLSAQVYRYFRASTAQERQQTRTVLFAFVILIAAYIPLFSLYFVSRETVDSPLVLVLGNVFPVIIPISIGLAILRSQLFDIDIIIRKTLQYTVVTVLLALIYFGSVFLLQRLFSSVTGQQSPLALVVSTLLIAALFAPLRRRIQDGIDRRFYRKKYDAQQVLAQFARTARDETDMNALLAELERVVQETLQPEGVRVWLRKP